MNRHFLLIAALLGFSAVALGAFGAHLVSAKLAPLADGAKRLAWWETAASYHMAHALALGLVAVVAGDTPAGRVACWALVVGICIFSGSLYAMTLGAPRWFGAITPLGGTALMVGWAAMAWAALKLP